MLDTRRRHFITLVGGAAAAWPLASRAQQISKPARLGYIWIGAKDSARERRHRRLAGVAA
jgi:putative tryptophan/tyrosine transport system substrate-binding protein